MTKGRGLGRGLDALMPEIDDAYENESSSNDSVIELSISNIKANPYQPRKHFDTTALNELAESIKVNGLIQPIVVTEDIDGYFIIAGERRFRASKIAKLKTIRAIITKSNQNKMREFALIENIQREDLNAVELANAYSELLKIYELTQDELSVKISKSRSHITNTIRLLQLSKKTTNLLVEKKITAGHAKVMVGLDEKQQQVVLNSIMGQKLNVRETENIIKNIKQPVEETKTTETTQPSTYNLSSIEDKLTQLGLSAKVSKNSIVIRFNDKNQVEKFDIFLNK